MKIKLTCAVLVAAAPGFLFAGKPVPPQTPFAPAVAYVQEKNSGTSDLMLMNADGSQKKLLVAGTSTQRPHAPSYSPDGSKIVFRYGAALYVVPTAGGTPWKLTALAEDHVWNTPAWSPNGQFIVFSDSRPSAICGCVDHDLFLVAVDAEGKLVPGSKVQLTSSDSWIEYFPSWSRDGSRLVSHVWITGTEQQLFVFGFDPATRTLTGSWSLTAGLGPMHLGGGRAQWNKSAAAFSNDVVVFSGYLKSETYTSNYDLWYVDVTTLLAGRLVASTSNFETSPSFSPTDARLVYHNEGTGTPTELAIVENAADLIHGLATEAVVTHTVATGGGKIVDLQECDWMPVP